MVPFDLDRLRAAPHVAALEYHATLGSTNDRALELVRTGQVAPQTLILAAEQTAGRGRGGNRWWASPGALTFSYVERLAPTLDRAAWPRWTLVAAVAVCDVIESLAPDLRPGVRWPNDVHVAGKKISGILVEAPAVAGAQPPLLVLGIGLNVNNSLAGAPDEVRAVATSLVDLTRQRHDRTDVLLRLLARLQQLTLRLAAQDSELVERWQALCILKGRRVGLRLGEREVLGLCQGIAPDGALQLDTPAGRERFFGGVLTRVE
ncbi:MAG: biotin--[acetyl-CoA-carboxylase] ligase [Planctomycetaceae bacterium]|nr:biotin--[acetyl-CoA-carboxylase] ligase [Planctomycetaceae bacterium]